MTDIHEHPYVKELGRQIDELEKENAELRRRLSVIVAMCDSMIRSSEPRDK